MTRMTKEQWASRTAIIKATRDIMVQRFPLAFVPKGSPKIPLKIGIANDIANRCRDISLDHLNVFFGDYAGGYRYLTAIIEGEHRFDLDGNIAGGISEIQKAHARAKLKKVQAQIEAAQAQKAARRKAADA